MENKEPAQEGMLSNSTYDFMAQLTEENQSLWRIKNTTRKMQQADAEATEFWNNLEKDKESHIRDLTKLLEKRLSRQ